MLIWILLIVVAIALLLPRLAPTDTARWHVPVRGEANADGAGSATRILDASGDTLAQLDTSMRALPRTKLIAGSLDEGRLTYETRSLVFGFPDYTTIEHDGAQVKMYARLRFGASDLGVNRKRLEGLIASLPK